MPTDTEIEPQALRGLDALAQRDVRRRHIEKIVARAGLSLSAAAAWLLVRLEEDACLEPDILARSRGIEPEILRRALLELSNQELIVERPCDHRNEPGQQLTTKGCEIFNRLVAARREHLAELWPEWSPEKREEAASVIRRLAQQIVPETKLKG